jgi:hypothetical protein
MTGIVAVMDACVWRLGVRVFRDGP